MTTPHAPMRAHGPAAMHVGLLSFLRVGALFKGFYRKGASLLALLSLLSWCDATMQMDLAKRRSIRSPELLGPLAHFLCLRHERVGVEEVLVLVHGGDDRHQVLSRNAVLVVLAGELHEVIHSIVCLVEVL